MFGAKGDVSSPDVLLIPPISFVTSLENNVVIAAKHLGQP